MRGKLARILRKMIGFDPHEKRTYKQAQNSNNMSFNPDTGELEAAGGTVFEVEKAEDGKDTILTKRSIYKISKKKWARGE